MYTVLATSGYIGEGWKIMGQRDTKKEAETLRDTVATSDMQRLGYITAIVRQSGRTCIYHAWPCEIFDTSRVPVNEPHLRGRNVHCVWPESLAVEYERGPAINSTD